MKSNTIGNNMDGYYLQIGKNSAFVFSQKENAFSTQKKTQLIEKYPRKLGK
jgi:hypothetical protein